MLTLSLCIFLDSAWGIAADTVCNEGVNNSLCNQPVRGTFTCTSIP